MPRSLRWGLHKQGEKVLKQPLAIEHRPQGRTMVEAGSRFDGHKEDTNPQDGDAYQPCGATPKSFLIEVFAIFSGAL